MGNGRHRVWPFRAQSTVSSCTCRWSCRSLVRAMVSSRVASVSPADSGSEQVSTSVRTVPYFDSEFLSLHQEVLCCPAFSMLCTLLSPGSGTTEGLVSPTLRPSICLLRALSHCSSVGCKARAFFQCPSICCCIQLLSPHLK